MNLITLIIQVFKHMLEAWTGTSFSRLVTACWMSSNSSPFKAHLPWKNEKSLKNVWEHCHAVKASGCAENGHSWYVTCKQKDIGLHHEAGTNFCLVQIFCDIPLAFLYEHQVP